MFTSSYQDIYIYKQALLLNKRGTEKLKVFVLAVKMEDKTEGICNRCLREKAFFVPTADLGLHKVPQWLWFPSLMKVPWHQLAQDIMDT